MYFYEWWHYGCNVKLTVGLLLLTEGPENLDQNLDESFNHTKGAFCTVLPKGAGCCSLVLDYLPGNLVFVILQRFVSYRIYFLDTHFSASFSSSVSILISIYACTCSFLFSVNAFVLVFSSVSLFLSFVNLFSFSSIVLICCI